MMPYMMTLAAGPYVMFGIVFFVVMGCLAFVFGGSYYHSRAPHEARLFLLCLAGLLTAPLYPVYAACVGSFGLYKFAGFVKKATIDADVWRLR